MAPQPFVNLGFTAINCFAFDNFTIQTIPYAYCPLVIIIRQLVTRHMSAHCMAKSQLWTGNVTSDGTISCIKISCIKIV